MMPALSPFVRTPTADTIVYEEAGSPVRIKVSAYSDARGFTQATLIRDENCGFEPGLALVQDPAASLAGLSPDQAMELWGAGLIALPPECPAPFVPEVFTTPRDHYAANGFTELSECVSPAMIATLAAYYHDKVEAGALRRGDSQADRYVAHNDPAGRVIQRALRPAMEHLVGCPIKASYTYASLYCGGADLPVHTDRAQCQYTLSLLIEHLPAPTDGMSPWAVQVYTNPEVPPVECRQSVGGGIVFRGHEIRHGRQRLPDDHSCWVLLLHYVDADFAGALD